MGRSHHVRRMKRVLVISLLACLSGCLAIAPVKHNVFYNPSDAFITTGLTDKFNLGIFAPLGPENDKHNYALEDKHVVWWGQTSSSNELTNLPLVTIQWIAPDGSTHKEEQKRILLIYVTSTLPIKGVLNPSMQGEWKARIFLNNRLYEEKSFVVGNVTNISSEESGLTGELKEKLQIESHGAVALFHDTSIQIEEDGSCKTKYHARFKVLNERGKKLAEVFIPYNDRMELFRIIKAYTITPSGKTIDASEARVVAIYPGYSSYTGNAFVEFAMPAVDVGSIIEYEVEIVSVFPIVKDRILYNSLLPYDYPVLSARIQLTFANIVPERTVKARLYNADAQPVVERVNDGKKCRYTWRLVNQAPMTVEPLGPPYSEYVPEIIVSDYSSWDEVAEWAQKTIVPDTPGSSAVEELVHTITQGSANPMDSARKIFRYVQDNIRYVSVALAGAPAAPQSISDILKNKYGDCKDCAVLLAAMLDVIGLKTQCVLVRTIDQGGIRFDTPHPYQFNHVVNMLETSNGPVWLDATGRHNEFGRLPEQSRSAFGLILKDGAGEFKRLPSDRADENERLTENAITLNNSGDLIGVLQIIARGDIGKEWRRGVHRLNVKEREEEAERIARSLLGPVEIEKQQWENLENPDSDFVIQIQYGLKNQIVSLGNLIAIAPLKRYHTTFRELTARKRVHDIVLTQLFTKRDKVSVKIPAGYKIKEIPPDFSIQRSFGSTSIKYESSEKKIGIVFTEKITRERIKARDYCEHQEYREKIAKELNRQIVFEQIP